MKKQQSIVASKKTRFLWYGLVIILTICAILFIFNRSKDSTVSSYQQIELLKDSLRSQSRGIEKPSLFSTWINVVQQKQVLEVFQSKDSLTIQDKQLIKKIDQQLNTMLHERN